MAGVATGQVVKFQVFADPDLVTGLFDVIEVWRSRSLEAGPYEEITGPQWSTASHAIAARPFSVVGLQLGLRVNEKDDVVVTFTGTDPLDAATIASQVQTQSNGLLRASATDLLTFETAAPGAAATLRVLESDVAGILALPLEEPSSVAFGHDARTTLLPDVSAYTVIDPHGSSSYFYKIRFRNASTGAVSEFSAPFSGTTIGGVDPALIVRGFVKLVDMLGKPLVSYNVLIHNTFKGVAVGDKIVIGGPLEKLTDANGEAEFFLVRGLIITVSVAGTNLVREVTIPTDPAITSINLLDGAVGQDDVFKVQVPNIPYAERRSI